MRCERAPDPTGRSARVLPIHAHAIAPIQAAETGMRRRLPAGESRKGLAVKLWKAENRPDWSLCWRCAPLRAAEKATKLAQPTRELNPAASSVLARGTGRGDVGAESQN